MNALTFLIVSLHANPECRSKKSFFFRTRQNCRLSGFVPEGVQRQERRRTRRKKVLQQREKMARRTRRTAEAAAFLAFI